MKTFAYFALFPLLLLGCDAGDAMKEGLEHSNAVATSLERSVGVKSFVGFNWHDGKLLSVSVNYADVPQNRTLQEIIAESTRAVKAEFKQTPESIVVSFSVRP